MTTAWPAVWVDDSHAIYRRGLASCLSAEGFVVRGESMRLDPSPTIERVDILVFECTGTSLRRAVRLVAAAPTKLVATVRTAGEGELATAIEAGVSAIVGL